jgi:hypothetical protein
VTFRLRAPGATSVTVSGSEFLKGSIPLTKDADGVWSVTVGPPEIYDYNMTIDGVKTIGPGDYEVKFGSTASTIASLLDVPGDGPRFFDDQFKCTPATNSCGKTHGLRRASMLEAPFRFAEFPCNP